MTGAVPYICLFLTFAIPIHECARWVYHNGKCVKEEPCFDLGEVERIAGEVSKNLIAADGESILLKHSTFDEFRKKKDLHSCVLYKIIDLFEEVLSKTEGRSSVQLNGGLNYHTELIHIMDQLRKCVYNSSKINKRCENLYTKAYNTPSVEMPETEMKPVQAAILQLQKLKYASEKLDDVNVQERVMDELKSLHLYMQGNGFRKKLMTEERHENQ